MTDESQEPISTDIYAIAVRVKNLARTEGNLTSVGEIMCNYYINVMKAFYDYAEKLPEPYKKELTDLVKNQEGIAWKLDSIIA